MALCSSALKSPKDGAIIASLGDLLQGWPNLLMTKSFLMSNLNLQSCKQGCCSSLYPLIPLHHLVHLPVFCRLLLDPSSPKSTTSAHTAPMLWSTAREKSLIATKMDPQLYGHVSLEISDYWVRNYWTYILPSILWHKLITTSSLCFIIASFQLKSFKCIKI